MVMAWLVNMSCIKVGVDYLFFIFKAYKKFYEGDKIKAQSMVDENFSLIDVNGSGKVDFSEFVAAVINREKLLSKEKIE